MLEILEFKSTNPGKSILITGAIHGNEVCGTIASQKIISKIKNGEIKIKNGSITFIPICNPKAHALNKRFYETNLNRVIKKHKNPKFYEDNIANILTDYIKKSDYLLDLHSMHCNGNPFVFQDYEHSKDFVKILDLEYIFIGWPEVYKNSKTIKDYSTENYAYRNKTIGCTVECGTHDDLKSIEVAESCIMKALSYLGIIDYNFKKTKNQKFIKMHKVFFKDKDGSFAKEFIELDRIKKNDVIISYDDGKKIISDDDYFIIFPNKKAEIGQEWFFLGKKL